MPLITQIQNHVIAAMKAGDRLKLTTLRMLVAAIKQKEIDTRSDLSDDDIISIIEKQMQQRLEAAEQYEAAGRNELFEKESQEAEILKATVHNNYVNSTQCAPMGVEYSTRWCRIGDSFQRGLPQIHRHI